MPEGHSVHRLANAFRDHFVGQVLAASSPQGRFAEGAAALDGKRLLAAEAYGKQMFLGFEDDLWLRVHLGMYGMWRFDGPGLSGIGRRARTDTEEDEEGRPLPRGVVRLRLASATHIGDLSGPTFCGIETPGEKAVSVAAIGPDPLRQGARPGRAWDAISASRTAIAQLLMRQDIIGGVGNIYRAELLFRARIEPHKPGRDLSRAQFDALWRDARALMRDGVRDGAIITTRPKDRPEGIPTLGRRMRKDARSYVAFRNGEPCRICGEPVAMEPMAGRKLYWCPTCQTE